MSSTTSNLLIEELKLEKHPAGGYWRETDRQDVQIPSPFAPNNAPRPLVTSIYHLLTPESPYAVFIKNRSVAYHILHQGKAEYTVITPGNPPKVEKKVLGTNTAAGESRFLTFGSEVWKMAKLISDSDSEGCLLSLVVAPGFHWEDHEFLTKEGLDELFQGVEGGEEKIAEFQTYLK
ncbi:duf985 domain-containing protein [Moniliophthora roreri MCA 2997]|uniref:Duf985 domain-containing protein n=2 Tax=Moniliophthora roreri TaxID=221103 RepID=V2WFU7_MONRO|nr:duf985 domain-containing protein [Moniliophthora roreri MCA 2997]KAI3603947.1 duf985 domain-containing protein [Moniliophthora roreri]